MVWSDERIALLTQLWAEGLSASKIASRLGDVTRNAVIGKVHRLGLPGRVTASRKASQRSAPRPTRSAFQSISGSLALKPRCSPAPAPKPRLAIVRQPVEKPDAPPGAQLLDLEEHMCRWPEGDPKQEGFHFCGRRTTEGQSYCLRHLRLAFRPLYCRRV